MHEVYNSGWYGANELVPWPLLISPVSADGVVLPASVLADLKVVSTAGTVFLSGVQISNHFVSVVLSRDAGIAAALTVPQPVKPHKAYPLNTFYPGIAGVVVFGHGARTERGMWHMDADQGALVDACCIETQAAGVTSFGKKGTEGLRGAVPLIAGSDLVIRPQTFHIGVTRADGDRSSPNVKVGQGFLIELSPDASKRVTGGTSKSEMLQAYAGPCAVRPENEDGRSDTCPYITSINGVLPDSSGNINVHVDTADDTLSITEVVQEGAWPENDLSGCKGVPVESVTFLLGDSEPFVGEESTSYTEFRRCNNDYCQDAIDAAIIEAGGTLEADPFESLAVVPGTSSTGFVYDHLRHWLSPESGSSGVVYAYEPDVIQREVEAQFSYYWYGGEDAPEIGLLYNIRKSSAATDFSCFRVASGKATLGATVQLLDVRPGTTVGLKLTQSGSQITGMVSRWDSAQKQMVNIAELTTPGTWLGVSGIYFKNSKVLTWTQEAMNS